MLKNKIKGALYGFAVGDALGCTTEFMTEEQIKRIHGVHKNITGGGMLGWERGDVTDDTDLMLCVGRAYMHKESFLQNCADEFSKWYKSNPRDIGNCCRIVMSACADKPYKEWMLYTKNRLLIGHHKDYGNGSLMRALVPAMCGDYESAIAQGRLTHNNALCDSIIKSYSEYLYNLLNGENLLICPGELDPTGMVMNTIVCAHYAVFRYDNFESSLIHVVNRGGDSDTIGAIAGSLAGAYHGYDKIPVRWRNALHRSTRKELDALADFIYAKLMSKTAYWEDSDMAELDDEGMQIVKDNEAIVCSNCKCGFSKAALWKRNFCPNCGRPMKENNDG